MDSYKVYQQADDILYVAVIAPTKRMYKCNGHKVIITAWQEQTLGKQWIKRKLTKFKRYARNERRHRNG